MKVASWNINSLRVRLLHVLDWIQANGPDVLALQETKMTDDVFPADAFEAAGYEVCYSGQKTYNGVAIVSKKPAQEVIYDVPGLDDPQRRILGATIQDVRILNLYVVNGSEVGSDKYAYKLNWISKVSEYINEEMDSYQYYVVLGDFNIAPEDRDVHNPRAWHEKILCSTPEREALDGILQLGFNDSFRMFEQDKNIFSWWDYRSGGFQKNQGLRIDLILANKQLASKCRKSWVDLEPRKLERPSDHAPVVAEFDL
jgi:exodeoxyribonuclease III